MKFLEKGRKDLSQSPETEQWRRYIEDCHQHPIGDIKSVRQTLTDLNTRQFQSRMEFHLIPVVNGAISPDVLEEIPHIKVERTGPVIQELLNRLPESVRKGTDPRYEVWQIRLDEHDSWEHLQGTTTLLTVLLNSHEEGEACFLPDDDPNSHTNWEVIKKMHQEHFEK